MKTRSFIFGIILIVMSLGLAAVNPSAAAANGNYQLTETGTTTAVSPTDISTETPTDTPSGTPTINIIGGTFTEPPADTASPTITSTSEPIDIPNLSGDFLSDELLVILKRKAAPDILKDCIPAFETSVKSSIEALHTVVLKVPDGKIAEAIRYLQGCEGVKAAEPNYLAQIVDVIPSDPNWNLQYGLVNIRAPQGWQVSTGSNAVTIAIIDTGVDLTHPDLAGKIVGGYDFVNNDTIAQDDNGHGTHVAGIAAAISNNDVGVAGVSWGARLMPIKVLNAAGNGSYADVANGIVWAADHGAQVINLSLGGNNPSQVLQDAVDYADSNGVVLVAASGNTGSNLVLYPARYPNVIAVVAVDSSNARAGFSNYGPEVDLSAPGVAIYSTTIGGYQYRSGTSMATPFVSGLAAILWGIPGNSSASAITSEMENTALDLGAPGFDNFFGHGLIQMDAALQLVPPTSTPASQLSFPSGGNLIPIPTFTLTPTPTTIFTPITQTATLSSTPLATQTHQNEITDTPEVIALETVEPQAGIINQELLFPCCGILLILMGIILFWVGSRRSRKGYRDSARYFL